MRWGRTVLIFQAFATIFIGMAFLIQVINLDTQGISELTVEVTDGLLSSGDSPQVSFVDIKQRYTVAAYVLSVIALIELMIISRLIS